MKSSRPSHLLPILAGIALCLAPSVSLRAAESAVPQKTHEVASTDTSISWMGYTWTVKAGSGLGPGPNVWSADNVFVDSDGFLHLKITENNGVWSCAELYTTTDLGFGTYQWQVEAPLSTLDPNVVLGLFPYEGPDGTHEIDIEYSRWGNAANPDGWWTVYPASGTTIGQTSYSFTLDGTYTTSRFTWEGASIAYRMLGGFYPPASTTHTIQSWTYAPAKPTVKIPQQAMPLHMNLWLYQGLAPSNGKGVEVIIHSFQKS